MHPGPQLGEARMQGAGEASALQKFACTVSLAQNTRRAVEMFKKKAQRPAPAAAGPGGMAPIETAPSLAPVLPPPSSTKKHDVPSDPTLDTADVHISASGPSVATDFKPLSSPGGGSNEGKWCTRWRDCTMGLIATRGYLPWWRKSTAV